MKIINIVILFWVIFLSSCSLWKANDWNAYKVTLEVQDESGQAVPDVNIQTAGMHEKKTNNQGRATLFYTQAGFHIATLHEVGMLTKQIKIDIPRDANKIVTLSLKSK
ncbi:MAG: hypothetical protein OEM38_00230 [Gammaproteobacteria bacterium]|nr:hypothetical protein [Gammaproteobacteria bacterium]